MNLNCDALVANLYLWLEYICLPIQTLHLSCISTLKDKLNWPVLHLQYLQNKPIPRPTIFFWSSHKQNITCRQWFGNIFPMSNSTVSFLLKTHYLLYLPQEACEIIGLILGKQWHFGSIENLKIRLIVFTCFLWKKMTCIFVLPCCFSLKKKFQGRARYVVPYMRAQWTRWKSIKQLRNWWGEPHHAKWTLQVTVVLFKKIYLMLFLHGSYDI